MNTYLEKKKMGRSTKLTETTVQKLEMAFRNGFNIETACAVSGICRSSYYTYINQDPDFMYKMEAAQQWITQRAKQVVASAINSGDVKSAKWWLERRARAEFAANPNLDRAKQELLEDEYNRQQFINDTKLAALEYQRSNSNQI
jgi:hypothetical protein